MSPTLYALKYEFKPKSVDSRGLGDLVVRGVGGSTVSLSTTAKGVEQFHGKRNAAKPTECVMLFNEDEQCFYIDKLAYTVTNLRHKPRSNNTYTIPPPKTTSVTRREVTRRTSPRKRKSPFLSDCSGDESSELSSPDEASKTPIATRAQKTLSLNNHPKLDYGTDESSGSASDF